MYLSDSDKKILFDKEDGAKQFSMQILIKLGEIYGAQRMVPIKSAHVGCLYPQFGAATEIMKKFTDLGGQFCVPTTANPALNPINFNKWDRLNEPLKLQKLAKKQIVKRFNSLAFSIAFIIFLELPEVVRAIKISPFFPKASTPLEKI